ncbi:MAG: type IV pilus assembly protein PilM [Lentisphaerae bacterium]|nr:type IV pilus assembly protein PilM [Lentisphaerota bacterium]
MARNERMIALDVGASKLVLAEFGISRGGELELLDYGIAPLAAGGESELDASAYIVSATRDLMRERSIRPAPLLMAMSGQAVFPRYVKLPPVSRDKVFQIIQYEAEQNVPFPINEVVWDYQLVEDAADELNVMLVAVKTENVKRLTDAVGAAGLEPEVVDVAPMALYNCVRYNYPDLAGCTLVLDIGARSSNLIFIEGNRVFTRSVPVAGNAITQEIAKQFGVDAAEAEALKREHAYVGLGGVYAEAENETADRVSKIVRSVVTRLHAEVNRSINFYRSQQDGNPPVYVLLAGGGAVIPHMDTFFREKLKCEVDYLNPFVNVPVAEGLDTERVSGDVQVLGEVVGLGLRRALTCPMEINLLPPDLVKRKALRRRQPFFALAALGLVLILLCWWVYFYRMRETLAVRVVNVEQRIDRLDAVNSQLEAVRRLQRAAGRRAGAVVDLIALRTRWIEMLNAIHDRLADGMWLSEVKPVVTDGVVAGILISGQGFVDRLEGAGEASAIEAFRNRLVEAPFFTEETRITRQPVAGTEAFAREFTIELALKEGLRVE